MAAAGSAVFGADHGPVRGLAADGALRCRHAGDFGGLRRRAAISSIVIAFRGGVDVAAIAPFRYTLLIWAGVCGYLAFGEVPDRYAIFGSALIVGSGLYALHREVVRRRTVAAAVPPAEPGA